MGQVTLTGIGVPCSESPTLGESAVRRGGPLLLYPVWCAADTFAAQRPVIGCPSHLIARGRSCATCPPHRRNHMSVFTDLAPELIAVLRLPGHHRADPGPGRGHPRRHGRARRAGPRPHGLRQDARVRPPDPGEAGRQALAPLPPPRPDHRPDPRAGQPGRRRDPAARRLRRPEADHRLRRHAVREADPAAPAEGRPRRRDARPAGGPVRERLRLLRRHRDDRPRRGRPPVRPRLLPVRRQADGADPRRQPADAAQRHPRRRRRRAGAHPPARPAHPRARPERRCRSPR